MRCPGTSVIPLGITDLAYDLSLAHEAGLYVLLELLGKRRSDFTADSMVAILSLLEAQQ